MAVLRGLFELSLIACIVVAAFYGFMAGKTHEKLRREKELNGPPITPTFGWWLAVAVRKLIASFRMLLNWRKNWVKIVKGVKSKDNVKETVR